MTEADFNLIKESEIYEIGLSEDDSLTEFITDKNLKVKICFCEETIELVSKNFDII